MNRGRGRGEGSPTPPLIRRAPLPELKIYEISEDELNRLARGSPSSLFLNFAVFLLPIALTLFVTLTTTTIPSVYLFAAYVAVCAVALIAGLLLLALWWREHGSSQQLIEEIRRRMPPLSVQDSPAIAEGEP